MHQILSLSLTPLGKRITALAAAIFDECWHPLAARHQFLHEAFEMVLFAAVPLWRQPLQRLVDDVFRKMFDTVKPWLEIVEGAHGLVDVGAKVETLKRRVIELPVGASEEIAVVDHEGDEALLQGVCLRLRRPLAHAGA